MGHRETYRVLPEPLPLAPPAGVVVPDGYHAAADRAWRTAELKVPAYVRRAPDTFPVHTVAGRWVVEGDAWTNWCEGFLGGQLWLLAGHTGRRDLRALAEHYSLLVEDRQHDREVHDLGFVFWPTWRRWYEATGDPARDAVVVQAGRTTASRFQEKGRYLRSFLAPESLLVDIMMNVGVVFHAARRTGDPDLARIAWEHCLTSRRHLVRGDGSTAQEAIFDVGTGAFRGHRTLQGHTAGGSWARGLAWALHGFGTAYRYTGDRRFRDVARACADYYLEQTGDDLVCPNDWTEPDPPLRYESSAAAVAAGGLWQLGCLLPDRTAGAAYAGYALRVLHRLCGDEFLSAGLPAWEGLLLHGVYHRSRGLGIDESTMWGDYWLLDTLAEVDTALR